ncbi:MAG: flagellar hook-basal body complex protein FliE [Vulcanimicrobiaceae bacterium]
MRVEPLLPDSAPLAPRHAHAELSDAFAHTLDNLAETLHAAEQSEDRFARGTGSLVDSVYERARADVALSVATAAAQRSAQAVSSVLNLQL